MILLTGNKGFIGKNLSVKLQDKIIGFEKEDMDGDWESKIFNTLCCNSISSIFHVGADSSTLSSDINEVFFNNYILTASLSNFAYDLDIPLIFSSSFGVYGNEGLPITPYGWSKKFAEDHVIANGQIALRYTNVYGPGEENKRTGRSVAYDSYIKKQNGQEVFLFPDTPKRDFVYIDDVVSANIYALENYRSLRGQYYDVGCGVAEPFEKIMEIVDIPFSYLSENPISNYQHYTCADPTKFMVGWTPKFDLSSGLKKYKEYLDA